MARTYVVVDANRKANDPRREVLRGTLTEFDIWYNANRPRLAGLPTVVEEGSTKTYIAASLSGRPL